MVVNELRPAIIGEHRSIEPEPGAHNDAIVENFLLHLVGPGETDGYQVLPIALFDAFDIAIQQSVLGLQLISIEQVVIYRTEVSYVVGLPCQPDGTGASHMNYRCRFDKVVRGFKSRVPLPDDEHALIGEVAWIHRYSGVEFGGFDAGNRRTIRLRNSCRHDQARCFISPAVLVSRMEDTVARYPHDAGVVLNLQLRYRSKVAEIAHHFISRGEITFGVAREAKTGIIRKKRVPVHAEVELRVAASSMWFIAGNEPAMPRERAEKGAGS